MTALADIENALLQRLSMLRVGTAEAFKTIDGLAGTGTTRLMAWLRRRPKPAALVRYAGRKRTSTGQAVQLSLYVAAEGLRGDGEARIGGDDVNGMHPLLDLLREALDGATLLCGCRLGLVSESAVADDDRIVVFQQTYEVEGVG